MTQKIEVAVGKDGEVQVEFIGFAGDECFDEAERLQDILASMGLEVDVKEIVRKSMGEIERELGIEDDQDELQVRRSE